MPGFQHFLYGVLLGAHYSTKISGAKFAFILLSENIQYSNFLLAGSKAMGPGSC
ncbi:hypothetical protein I79_026111 [Cricetulus griseus]|uniref:Uncharacterized protein n=1 Tax=Cricetulus griseus TaxID=10029 RepID=G3IQ23_CRIGR|nr:hypothetical protein I79_026111 [Cricetulus griseus]